MSVTVECEGPWNAKDFKEVHKYGREFYYRWDDSDRSSIELTYRTDNLTKLSKFYNSVTDGSHFRRGISMSDATVSFALQITRTESDDDLKKRI